MDKKNRKKENIDKNNLQACKDLIRYQIKIAERWLKRGNEIEDIFAKFCFYYAGFNAIYFLWSKIDNLNPSNQTSQIENFLKKIDASKAQKILNKIKDSMDYFCKRRSIQQMQRRSCASPYNGDESEGKKRKIVMQANNKTASNKLVALGGILYFIRCNLVHGSKEDSGDDDIIIQNSIEPLKILLKEALSVTKHEGKLDG